MKVSPEAAPQQDPAKHLSVRVGTLGPKGGPKTVGGVKSGHQAPAKEEQACLTLVKAEQ